MRWSPVSLEAIRVCFRCGKRLATFVSLGEIPSEYLHSSATLLTSVSPCMSFPSLSLSMLVILPVAHNWSPKSHGGRSQNPFLCAQLGWDQRSGPFLMLCTLLPHVAAVSPASSHSDFPGWAAYRCCEARGAYLCRRPCQGLRGLSQM